MGEEAMVVLPLVIAGVLIELLFLVCEDNAEPHLRPCAIVHPSINWFSWSALLWAEFGEGSSDDVEGIADE